MKFKENKYINKLEFSNKGTNVSFELSIQLS